MKKVLASAVVLALCACRFGGEERAPEPKNQPRIGEAERVELDSAALSELAALEAALADYVKARSRAPERLEDLAPKYIPEIPYLDLGVPGHKPSALSQTYPVAALKEGRPDPAWLKDTGRWGYVSGGERPAVFIDCSHIDSRGRAWHSEKGAF